MIEIMGEGGAELVQDLSIKLRGLEAGLGPVDKSEGSVNRSERLANGSDGFRWLGYVGRSERLGGLASPWPVDRSEGQLHTSTTTVLRQGSSRGRIRIRHHN